MGTEALQEYTFQLGHVFSDMEMAGGIRLSRVWSCVSIGPRPFRHGNKTPGYPTLDEARGFQLGHVLSDMEIDHIGEDL